MGSRELRERSPVDYTTKANHSELPSWIKKTSFAYLTESACKAPDGSSNKDHRESKSPKARKRIAAKPQAKDPAPTQPAAWGPDGTGQPAATTTGGTASKTVTARSRQNTPAKTAPASDKRTNIAAGQPVTGKRKRNPQAAGSADSGVVDMVKALSNEVKRLKKDNMKLGDRVAQLNSTVKQQQRLLAKKLPTPPAKKLPAPTTKKPAAPPSKKTRVPRASKPPAATTKTPTSAPRSKKPAAPPASNPPEPPASNPPAPPAANKPPAPPAKKVPEPVKNVPAPPAEKVPESAKKVPAPAAGKVPEPAKKVPAPAARSPRTQTRTSSRVSKLPTSPAAKRPRT